MRKKLALTKLAIGELFKQHARISPITFPVYARVAA